MGSTSAPQIKADDICIIGAGASGLAAAKYLRAEKAFSRIIIFESRANVGGLWNHFPFENQKSKKLPIPQTNPTWSYDDESINDHNSETNHHFISPLYDRLETNIPRGLMGFSDLDWDSDLQLFPKHPDVLDYIHQYSKDVLDLVEFNTQVVDVSFQPETRKWHVKTDAVDATPSHPTKEHVFDAVIVASGHFDVPHIPSVPGIEMWDRRYPGRISHSKFYRNPEEYAGMKVIVVGNSASGVDIGAQVLEVCRQPLIQSQKSESLFLSDRSPTKVEKPQIVEYIVEGRSVRFEDGSVESGIDAILYCTGYFYSFPFLRSLNPPVITTGERTEQLYQHIFYRPQPTLSFLVLNQKVIPFPVAEAQSSVIARVLSGRLTLPSEGEMSEWESQTITSRGRGGNFHVLKFPDDADYINMLHDWAMTADREQGMDDSDKRQRAVGKIPPHWGDRERWIRPRFPLMKKTFQDLGENRRSVRTLEELGFDYEAWKRENATN